MRKVNLTEIIREEAKFEHVDNWNKAKNASAIETFNLSHPITKHFFLGLGSGPSTTLDIGFCGKIINSIRKVVSPEYISCLGIRDGFLIEILTRSKEAYNLLTRSCGASPKYTTIRRYLNQSIPFFHPDRPDQDKISIFDNEQTTTYKSRIGGVE